MSKPNNKTNALTVLSATELVTKDEQLEQLKTVAAKQVTAISKMEGNAARVAIICGLTFHRLKASLPHGAFLPFIDQMFPKGTFQSPVTLRKNVSFYMRLAAAFVAKAKIKKNDVLALPDSPDPLALEIGEEHQARRFMEKLDAFAGDCSLNELLIKHGIKGVGLKKELEKQEAKEEAEAAKPDAEQLYFQYRDEVGGILLRAQSLFIEEGALAHLIGHPEELQGVAKGFRDLADKIDKQVDELVTKEPAIPAAEDVS